MSTHRRRVFWRFYGHGALVLVSTTLLLGGVAWLFREQSPWARTPERLAAALERELGGDLADPGRLQSRLADFADLIMLKLPRDRTEPDGRVHAMIWAMIHAMGRRVAA